MSASQPLTCVPLEASYFRHIIYCAVLPFCYIVSSFLLLLKTNFLFSLTFSDSIRRLLPFAILLSAWNIFHLISLKSYLLPLFKTHLTQKVYG